MYHTRIADQFGSDLSLVLGPKADRVKWHDLDANDQQRRLRAFPTYLSTRELGSHPSLIDVAIYALNRLCSQGEMNPLRGLDLPSYGSLSQACTIHGAPPINYGSSLVPIDRLYKNAAKQRDVWLKHIFEDIIFQFDPSLVFAGIGRMTTDGRLFVNDAQHRTLACILMGINDVPINYIESDSEYYDVKQYVGININALSASDYDRWRSRCALYVESLKIGKSVDPECVIAHELKMLFDACNVKVVEEGDKSQGNSLVLSGIGNMVKYRKEYGGKIFARAVRLNSAMFPKSKVHTANCWGLMEFLRDQEGLLLDPVAIDSAIHRAVKKRWKKDSNGQSFHGDIKTSYRDSTKASATNSRVPEQIILAEGIRQVCERYEANTPWKQPRWPAGIDGFKLPLV